jgi:2-keto-3-deoxy-L-rhamnonate aldolase RhmA
MARANRIREIWAENKAVINSWCGVPFSFSAEVMAHAAGRPVDHNSTAPA